MWGPRGGHQTSSCPSTAEPNALVNGVGRQWLSCCERGRGTFPVESPRPPGAPSPLGTPLFTLGIRLLFSRNFRYPHRTPNSLTETTSRGTPKSPGTSPAPREPSPPHGTLPIELPPLPEPHLLRNSPLTPPASISTRTPQLPKGPLNTPRKLPSPPGTPIFPKGCPPIPHFPGSPHPSPHRRPQARPGRPHLEAPPPSVGAARGSAAARGRAPNG